MGSGYMTKRRCFIAHRGLHRKSSNGIDRMLKKDQTNQSRVRDRHQLMKLILRTWIHTKIHVHCLYLYTLSTGTTKLRLRRLYRVLVSTL